MAASPSSFRVRRMEASDMPAVHAIQSAAYPSDLHETVEVMDARRAVYPAGSFVVDGESKVPTGGPACAYVQGHPWFADQQPPCLGDADLHARLAEAAARREAYYVHDVASVATERGIGTRLFRHAVQSARADGYRTIVIVAVLENARRWAAQGFKTVRALDGYGAHGGTLMRLDAATELPDDAPALTSTSS